MTDLPVLQTRRLELRKFSTEDAADVKKLAGAEEIASTTLLIPHPYEENMARTWITSHLKKIDAGEEITYAITIKNRSLLVGAMSISQISREHERGELGYWIGKPFWCQGYCTEAAFEVLRYGFEQLKLNRVYATHFIRNPASGRVMQKIGMTCEGRFSQHVKKWGVFEDIAVYGILKENFRSSY